MIKNSSVKVGDEGKCLATNGGEFDHQVRGVFDPHDMTWAFKNFLMDRTANANKPQPEFKGVVYKQEPKLPGG